MATRAVVVNETDDGKEIPLNAAWRRMTADDAADAGALALAMNNATNNASLVLAFELSKGGKVLLFVGDAQAGNWRSWSEDKFDDDGTRSRPRICLDAPCSTKLAITAATTRR